MERKKFGKKPRLLVAVLKCLWLRLTILGAMIFLEVRKGRSEGGWSERGEGEWWEGQGGEGEWQEGQGGEGEWREGRDR